MFIRHLEGIPLKSGKKKRELVWFLNMKTICADFGWDFYTYMKQPAWFIESLSNFALATEAYSEQNSKKDK